jgi:DNA-binding response OmpR family regulator
VASILIADDSPEIRTLYGTCLRVKGHEVREAADGREAVERVRQQTPDLLILDVWMPRMNGFEVLDVLRNDSAASTMRVILLSVLGDGDSRLEAFAGGAVEYLVKGLGLEEFVIRIEAVLAEPAVPAIADLD